jgi:hypothetical protein
MTSVLVVNETWFNRCYWGEDAKLVNSAKIRVLGYGSSREEPYTDVTLGMFESEKIYCGGRLDFIATIAIEVRLQQKWIRAGEFTIPNVTSTDFTERIVISKFMTEIAIDQHSDYFITIGATRIHRFLTDTRYTPTYLTNGAVRRFEKSEWEAVEP